VEEGSVLIGVVMRHDKHTYGKEWSTSGNGGSYARNAVIKEGDFDIEIVPSNHDIFVGDPKQPTPKFYGGGYPDTAPAIVEPHNLNRLLRGSTADSKWLRLLNIFSLAVLFLTGQNRDSFVGDLQERYGLLLEKEGRRVATRWFWRQVVFSFLSLALDSLKKISGWERLFRRIGS
jgi:hypothetical protein